MKSNHHLTELIKISFQKKNPNLVSLYYRVNSSESNEADGENPDNSGVKTKHKKNSYIVQESKMLIQLLQEYVQEFK